MTLTERCIVITGGAGGLGAGTAEICLREGAVCVLADINDQALLHTTRVLGPRTVAICCDITSLVDVDRLVAQAVMRFGRIDGLVNCTGINFSKPFSEIAVAEWSHVMDTNLGSTFSLMQAICRQMLLQDRPGGSIVNIASVHAHATAPGQAAYSAAKAGLLGLTRAVALEYARLSIRVNTISPGLCDTALWRAVLDSSPEREQCERTWLASIPMRRVIAPHEVGELAAFLLSDRASAITGADYVIDGGLLASLQSGVA